MKKWIGPILCCVLLIGVALWGGNRYNALHAELVEAQTAALNTASATSTADTTTVRAHFVQGYDAKRVKADDTVAEKMFSRIFTWADYNAYMENRSYAEEECDGITDTSRLLTDIMPPFQKTLDSMGREVWAVRDNGRQYSMNYSGMTSHVVGIDNDKDIYSYQTVISVVTSAVYTNTDGTTTPISSSAKFVVTYDTNSDSDILNVEAYALP